jgi:hypothetical protein
VATGVAEIARTRETSKDYPTNHKMEANQSFSFDVSTTRRILESSSKSFSDSPFILAQEALTLFDQSSP